MNKYEIISVIRLLVFFHLKNKSNLQKHIFSVITHNASLEWFFLKADTTNPILFNWLFFNLNFSPWVCICLSSSSPLFLFFFPFLFPLVWCLSSWITPLSPSFSNFVSLLHFRIWPRKPQVLLPTYIHSLFLFPASSMTKQFPLLADLLYSLTEGTNSQQYLRSSPCN